MELKNKSEIKSKLNSKVNTQIVNTLEQLAS